MLYRVRSWLFLRSFAVERLLCGGQRLGDVLPDYRIVYTNMSGGISTPWGCVVVSGLPLRVRLAVWVHATSCLMYQCSSWHWFKFMVAGSSRGLLTALKG